MRYFEDFWGVDVVNFYLQKKFLSSKIWVGLGMLSFSHRLNPMKTGIFCHVICHVSGA